MVHVVIANGPWVEGDRAHLRRPPDHRHLGGTDLVGVPPRGELDPRGLHVVWSAPRDTFLKERIAAALLTGREDDARMYSLRPPLERRGAAIERSHDSVVDSEVVVDDVELRERP